MTRQQAQARIERGDTLTDIGQIDAATRRWLQREVKAGRVVKGVSYSTPNPKNTYNAAPPSTTAVPLYTTAAGFDKAAIMRREAAALAA